MVKMKSDRAKLCVPAKSFEFQPPHIQEKYLLAFGLVN